MRLGKSTSEIRSFYETNPSSGFLPRLSGDLHVHGDWWRNLAVGVAGGLKALELVEGPVEAPLCGGLVAGELGEGIRFVCIPLEGSSERIGLCFPLCVQLFGLL